MFKLFFLGMLRLKCSETLHSHVLIASEWFPSPDTYSQGAICQKGSCGVGNHV